MKGNFSNFRLAKADVFVSPLEAASNSVSFGSHGSSHHYGATILNFEAIGFMGLATGKVYLPLFTYMNG